MSRLGWSKAKSDYLRRCPLPGALLPTDYTPQVDPRSPTPRGWAIINGCPDTRANFDKCIGCKKCAEACLCGYIDIR